MAPGITTTPEAWDAKDQPFLVTVASRPLITLLGPGTELHVGDGLLTCDRNAPLAHPFLIVP